MTRLKARADWPRAGWAVMELLCHPALLDPAARTLCHIVCRGYLSTLRKQGHTLLATLETLFAGQPLYPAFA